jgi:hypothetical protein
VCALVEALGAGRVETIADILRTFNAQTGLRTQYKAFYNRLAQPAFPRFMRQIYRDILRNFSVNILRPATDGKLAPFQDVVVQDGSSFAVHDALARTFGGRFTTIRPAAVDVHTFLSLFHDQVIDVAVAPDKEAERQFLPPAETLTGKLLLADRGYQSLDYWAAVHAAGGFFLMRGTHDLNPRIRTVRGLHGALPRRRLDVDVEWDRPGGQTLRLRLVLIWIRPERAYTVLVSNVSRRLLTARHVATLYRLRWQIEWVFKAWKSYANLHAFTSTNPAIVEGLIWASLCAAALKRSLAHVAQRSNAARAHPHRDRVRGRMRFGLEYVGARA